MIQGYYYSTKRSSIISGRSNKINRSLDSAILGSCDSYLQQTERSTIISGGTSIIGKSTVSSTIVTSCNATIIGSGNCIVSSSYSTVIGKGLTLSSEENVVNVSCLKINSVPVTSTTGASTCMLLHDTDRYVRYRTLGAVASEVIDLFSTARTATASAIAADTYLLSLPISGYIKSGTYYKIYFTATKTGAGVASPTFVVRIGTNGTTADSAALTFNTSLAQTALTDIGRFEIDLTVTNYGVSSIILGTLHISHSITNGGFLPSGRAVAMLTVNSTAVNLTTAGLLLGISVNPGAAANWTIQNATITTLNPGP